MCLLREKCTPEEECILKGRCDHKKEWDPQEKYLNIPYRICFYALKEKMHKEFALYLYLKFHTSGWLKRKSLPVNTISRALGIKEKQINNCLNKLISRNWIGFIEKSDDLIIRGFELVKNFKEIKKLLIGNNKNGVKFLIRFLPNLKYFCFSSIVASVSKCNARKFKRNGIRKKSLAEPKCDGSQELNTLYEDQPFYSMGPNMISTQSLATLLGMSLSTIHLLKLGAFKLGYINIIPNKFLTDILVGDFWLFKKTHPNLHGLYLTKTGDVYIRGCDSLYSERILTKRK